MKMRQRYIATPKANSLVVVARLAFNNDEYILRERRRDTLTLVTVRKISMANRYREFDKEYTRCARNSWIGHADLWQDGSQRNMMTGMKKVT
jgi:hypothetical protein